MIKTNFKMENIYKVLQQHKNNAEQVNFTAVLNQWMPKLKKFVKHRLHTSEAKGYLPKNFYTTDDVLADVYIKIYENFDKIRDAKQLKLQLFKTANELIKNYEKKENRINKSLPVDNLLKEEIKQLQEELTVDADGEIILVSDLKEEDISYMQDDFKPKIYIFDLETEKYFAKSLGLTPDAFNDEKFRAIFGSLYAKLPETIRLILDLNAIGNLSINEIGEIMDIRSNEVEKIIFTVGSKLKTLK
jgi:RNA polymerase sigma factor (sigma-70 family)